MTRTWSVPSTNAICISPSASSSTPRRSIRRIGRIRSGGRGGDLRAGVPLRLEELAELLACRLQRDARHDRLEEAEDDELARILGRDPAAFEIEQLGLVDRADGRRVRRSPAVG